jgi:hypothetical protein
MPKEGWWIVENTGLYSQNKDRRVRQDHLKMANVLNSSESQPSIARSSVAVDARAVCLSHALSE